jgi:apolipoprotein N-acyltransferase
MGAPATANPGGPSGTARIDGTLGPRARLWTVLAAFLALYLASPGILTRDGLGWLAPLGVAGWALAAARPGRRAFLMETIGSAVGWTLILSWAGKVYWALLVWIGPGMGIYMALQGLALRRLARRFPLAVAAPAAWMLSETVRASLEPPFGFQWMRLGTWLHHVEPLNQAARLFGIGGLSLVAAALGGLVADLVRGRRDAVALAAGLAPLALALVAPWLVPPGASVPGPELLLVQPGTAQARKMGAGDPWDLFGEAVALTRAGVAQARAAGRPPADLVAWGETMLHRPVMAPGLAEAVESGVAPPPWWGGPELTGESVRLFDELQRNWVDVGLFGGRGQRPAERPGEGALEPGTAFVSGADFWTVAEGVVRRMNAVFLWEAPGRAADPVGKHHLVPTGETMMGLERIDLVREVMVAMAGYIPDLLPDEDPDRTLAFTARDGRTYELGISICFDNAFDDPYTLPLRRGPTDFHLVASNEAWFELSQEADQMVAFSRLQAIATDRSVVRATNSGVSIVLDPRGRELGRILGRARGGGALRDRESTGTLSVGVPVPAREARARTTPWVRFGRAWAWGWILGSLALLALAGRTGTDGNRVRGGG